MNWDDIKPGDKISLKPYKDKEIQYCLDNDCKPGELTPLPVDPCVVRSIDPPEGLRVAKDVVFARQINVTDAKGKLYACDLDEALKYG